MLQIETTQSAPVMGRVALAKDSTESSNDFAKLWDTQNEEAARKVDNEPAVEDDPLVQESDVEAEIGLADANSSIPSETAGMRITANGSSEEIPPEVPSGLITENNGKTALFEVSNEQGLTEKQIAPLTEASTMAMAALSPQMAVGGIKEPETQLQFEPSGYAFLDGEKEGNPISSGMAGLDGPKQQGVMAAKSKAVSTEMAAMSPELVVVRNSMSSGATLPDSIRKPSSNIGKMMSATDRTSPQMNAGAAVNIPTMTPTTAFQVPQNSAAIPIVGLTQFPAESPLSETSMSEPDFFQQIGTSTTSAARIQTVHPMQAHSTQVAQQVANATIQSQGGRTEISLNPEELGRVRIAMTTSDAGISVVILAERPETADLMRRNMEDLAREFRELGYDSVSFSFGEQSGESENPKDDESAHGAVDHAPIEGPSLTPITTVALRSGLDLKL